MERILYHPAVSGLLAALMAVVVIHGAQLAPLALMLVSLPIYMTGFRNGSRAALLALTVPVFALLLEGREPLVLFLGLGPYLLLPWLVVRWVRERGLGLQQAMGYGFLLGSVAVVLITLNGPTADPDSVLNHYLDLQKNAMVTEVTKQQTASALSPEQQAAFVNAVEQIVHTMRYLFAALVVLAWFLIQTLNLHLSRVMLSAQGAWHGEGEEALRALRLPQFWVWVVLLLVTFSYVGTGSLQQVAVNLLIFSLIPYLFQGWAVLDSWFRFKRIKRAIRLLFWAMVLLFWLQQFMLMLVLMGLFDTWFDFRQKMVESQNREG
ncbi:hypothetical protein Mmc1_2459 [Magnetococcus marinus MC-1]|uniref:DUF2232 domain-containing protein n=1 Tax=Magnetococcus marinus (strain ATCC BAA-1437 / JCM 17883 / MC-1) TaxID=156889 RepID=A0LAG6_MAGMM|nr:DUF2232 domain-containing protein [Magnetococcus marinus]ABK44959.1 hypothetical protein Mmc1_2459 [Magnetococcus marinus MC-1]